jgi:hypothetical protein
LANTLAISGFFSDYRGGKADVQIGVDDIGCTHGAREQAAEEERLPRRRAVKGSDRLNPVAHFNLGELGRDSIQGFIPRNPCPLSFAFASGPLQRKPYALGMVGEGGIVASLNANKPLAPRVIRIAYDSCDAAIFDVGNNSAC